MGKWRGRGLKWQDGALLSVPRFGGNFVFIEIEMTKAIQNGKRSAFANTAQQELPTRCVRRADYNYSALAPLWAINKQTKTRRGDGKKWSEKYANEYESNYSSVIKLREGFALLSVIARAFFSALIHNFQGAKAKVERGCFRREYLSMDVENENLSEGS